ncbi:hypothetical protein HOLleu_13442 [Holothuria leucospilota]|uniref:Uncharacterized protein n=1 Tax=Holothuria leucospilota TaxID=206669 RepID=A0A9Q1CCI1_HOLLE|nr:hypothetical protein HOLleu_13442 [Holothuria leucospilota]
MLDPVNGQLCMTCTYIPKLESDYVHQVNSNSSQCQRLRCDRTRYNYRHDWFITFIAVYHFIKIALHIQSDLPDKLCK